MAWKHAVLCLVLGQAMCEVLPIGAQTRSLFQYAVFYNGVMEFSDCAPTYIIGPVLCNSNIYVGSPSSLTFNDMVTASGTITSPANAGLQASSWTGTVTYSGTPAPGYQTNVPAFYYLGSNAQQILYPPATGENPGSPLGSQRYYNKAGMTIWISNAIEATYTIILKNSATDPSPVTVVGLCSSLTNANSYVPWLTVTNMLFDERENKEIYLTQIDVGKLSNWMNTNIYVYNSVSNLNKFNPSNSPLNIIWVADWRYSNSTQISAVRIMDGTALPAAGLTVATPNPLYVLGIYNAPIRQYLGTTNVTGTVPASFACDALTILSPAWNDLKSFQGGIPQTAASDTVNAAILAGNVPSTGTSSTTYSGGVQNLPRLLENWSGQTLTLNTSLVCLFGSAWAKGQFLQPYPTNPSGYYEPPTRQFYFNQNYNDPSGWPPGTPIGHLQVTSILLDQFNIQPDGTYRLGFTNVTGASFTVLASTDPSVPLTNWTTIGSAIEVSSGRFQFTDSEAAKKPRRFYVVRSP